VHGGRLFSVPQPKEKNILFFFFQKNFFGKRKTKEKDIFSHEKRRIPFFF
jgi:hypothetical protein